MKLTKEDKKKIAELRLFHNLPEKWIANKFGIHRTNVTYYTKMVDRYGFDIFDQLLIYHFYKHLVFHTDAPLLFRVLFFKNCVSFFASASF